MTNSADRLDQLSISQTKKYQRCVYGAPLVAIIIAGNASIKQSCCNHWDCPACGETRAKQEYSRIVYGCEVLQKEHQLYFWTLTCRGKECSIEEAEENYLAWTNVLLTNARTRAARSGEFWAYIQVTERQKKTRNHPHSHIITTYLPHDATFSAGKQGKRNVFSLWFTRANFTSSLGSQRRISEVASAQAVSRYVAKYLFKDTMKDVFPKSWHRVRYSQNFPHPPVLVPDFVTPLQKPADWNEARKQPVRYECEFREIFAMASLRMSNISLGKLDMSSILEYAENSAQRELSAIE